MVSLRLIERNRSAAKSPRCYFERRWSRLIVLLTFTALSSLAVMAQETPAQSTPASGAAPAPTGPDLTTQAAAAYTVQQEQERRNATPVNSFVDHVVDNTLELFDVESTGNTPIHYGIAALVLIIAILVRRIVTGVVFARLRQWTSRTRWTFDDRVFTALEPPVATAIVVFGIFTALSVLKLAPETDRAIGFGGTTAYSLLIFWALIRGFSALLDHAHQIAVRRGLSIAAFMPWIKKTLIAVLAIVGVLMVVQNLGYDVKALLAGLGIGGLAFALAAQDTIANVFGSVVVAIDQPFRAGDYVKIGDFEGTVEDIGLRSTRLRPIIGNLVILPNKMVAAEGITNLSKFTRRRADHVIGLTYSTSADKMDAIVAEIRKIIEGDPDVDATSVHVYFRDYSASSLDIWVAYNSRESDFVKFMQLRQRINLAIMRTVEAHGLEFAYPTQTIQFDGEVARKMAERGESPLHAGRRDPATRGESKDPSANV